MKKEAVFLIHGLLGAARNLYKLAEEISKHGFYVTAYDQRGHGHSEHAWPKENALTTLANDLFALMDSKSVAKAHVIGHSLGGRVALQSASLRPERLLSLIILDVGTKVSEAGRKELQDIISPLPEKFSSKNEAEEFLSKHPRELKLFLLSSLRKTDHGLQWVFDLQGIKTHLLPNLTYDQTEIWKNLRVPTFLVRGENSKHLSQSAFEEMLHENSKAHGSVISGAGHWIHVDNFKATLEAILTSLRRH